MRIALLGTRGTEKYGGFETFVHEITLRLQSDLEIFIFNRHSIFTSPLIKEVPHEYGEHVKVISTPSIRTKSLDTLVAAIFSFLTVIYLQFKGLKFSHFLVCNGANSPFLWLLRPLGGKICINVDGVERRRKKWGLLAKAWYLLGEYCSTKFADILISDAEVIRDYYQEKYKVDSKVICYGATVPTPSPKILNQLSLKEGKYFLYVSRLEPENNADRVLQAYLKAKSQLNDDADPIKLVIVGDVPYPSSYKNGLLKLAATCPDVTCTGYLFGDDYRSLQSYSLAYVQATEVGGTHPALIEAMASGCMVIANDTPEHREALAECGYYYRFNEIEDLARLMVHVHENVATIADCKIKAAERAQERYTWERIAQQYRELFSL